RSAYQIFATAFATNGRLGIFIGDSAILHFCFWILCDDHNIISVFEEFESIGRSQAERGLSGRERQSFVEETKINGKRPKLIPVLSETDEKARKTNPLIVAGALELAKSLLTGMMQTEIVKVLDLQDKKVIFEQGDKVMVALITDQYFESLAILTHEFVVQFERFFASVLPSWQGDLDVFAPTRTLVTNIFDVHLPARA
nr:hypothetical protein [Candidatus Sigynarchaeum springense]